MEAASQLEREEAERLMLALIAAGEIKPSTSPRMAMHRFEKAAVQMLMAMGELPVPPAGG